MTYVNLSFRMVLKKQEYHWHSQYVHLMLDLSLPVKDWKLMIKLRYAYLENSLRILLVFIFVKSYLKVSWICLNQLLHNMHLEARSIKFDEI
jgi:hypothetical protein